MKIFYFFLILLLVISCKERKQDKIVVLPKNEITKDSYLPTIDSIIIASLKDSLVIIFYKKNKVFWTDKSNRKKFLEILNNVEKEGLFQKDFDLSRINTYESSIDSLSEASLVDYDILITRNLSRYIKKVSKGSLDPNSLYDNWDLKENSYNFQEMLLNFQKKDSFDIAVESVKPNHIVYKRLREALKIINTFPKDTFRNIELADKLVLNDSSGVLLEIKKKLMYWKDLKPMDSLTPIFDTKTELAIKKFQIRHGLAPDGVIGKGTLMALNFSKKQRKEQIIANMERWRWYPRKFENDYLIINIPDYSLTTVRNNDTIRACKVIVGKLKRRTPVLSSKLTHLILNPTWTVPPTILEKDIIPAIIKDSSYLSRKNIIAYDINNQVVKSDKWQVEKAKTYRYVQSSGTYNSLGLIKFIFHNKFTIYLHDTNTKSYFDKYNRALSSGCVRVQNPLELAEYLLDNPKHWSLKKIDRILKEEELKAIYFKKDIYIHIFYWTAWSKNGTLQFRDDLYNLDAELYQKLRN